MCLPLPPRRVKYLGWLCLVAFALLVWFRQPPKPDKSALQLAQAHLAELLVDSATHAREMRELEDSLERRLTQAVRGQEEARRLAQRDSLLRVVADSLASTAVTAHDWELAYNARTTEADTLRRALSVAQYATNEALTALAFSRLQRIADSTRIAGFEQAAPIVLQASKPNWWKNRFVVTVNYGVTRDASSRVVAGPQLSAGMRVLPWRS